MAKSGAERQREYRERHGSNENEGRINMVLSVTAVTELERLAKHYTVTKRAMLERLIMQGITEEFNGAERARDLLEEHGGDRKAATRAFYAELKREYPGFTTMGKLPEHAEAQKRYRAVVSAIDREVKKTIPHE